jgi:hypothetical protein
LRGRSATGEFGLVIPVLIPVVEFGSEDHLREVIAYAQSLGIFSSNPHTCYLEEGGRDLGFAAQAALKRKVDPKGLLNPGKMKGVAVAPALAEALPRFL